MTITSEIQRIKNNIASCYSKCSDKGATLPTEENSDNLPNTIDSISSGTSGDLIFVKNNLQTENIPSEQKVFLNCSVSSLGNKTSTIKLYYSYIPLSIGNSFIRIIENIYQIDEELTLNYKNTTTQRSTNIYSSVYKYKNLYYWFDKEYYVTCYNPILNLFKSMNAYYDNLLTNNCNIIFAGSFYSQQTPCHVMQFNENGDIQELFSFSFANFYVNPERPLFYDKEYQFLYTEWHYDNLKKFYVYKINFEQKTVTFLKEVTINKTIIYSRTGFKIYPIDEHSFITAYTGVLYKNFIQSDGSIITNIVNGKGYSNYIASNYENSANYNIYNAQNKTFTIIDDKKILHILAYNDETISLDEIYTKDLSKIIVGNYIRFSTITDDYSYLCVGTVYNDVTNLNQVPIGLNTDFLGIQADTVSKDNFSTTTLSGFTTGNQDNIGKIEISTVLPPKQDVIITTNANNATISTKGVE